MERKTFIKNCCYTALALPAASLLLHSCSPMYYATARREKNVLYIAKSEFIQVKKNEQKIRQFVLVKTDGSKFPICLYRHDENHYSAALMECTHKGCELNVGGGIYSCPCHGSEFSIEGKVLEGPADKDLKIFRTATDTDFIHVYLT